MSTLFRIPPHAFVRHDDLKFFKANTSSVVGKRSPAPLRDGHIVLLAVDALVALHASFRKWRNHRRTLKALADLDERQLRDIGLTREETLLGRANYRSLAGDDEVRRNSP